mgnify:FL=1
MTKEDFKKGQTVWLYLAPHAYKYRKGMTTEERIITGTIVSVGRKYITVHASYRDEKFEIGNGFTHVRESGCVQYILRATKEEALLYSKREEIMEYILPKFGWGIVNRMSFEDLRTIKSIMEKYQ